MKRGEICLVSLNPTAGHEQQGKRPILIISPTDFNTLTGKPVVLPIISSRRLAYRKGFAVSLANTGTDMYRLVRRDQPRAFDLAARKGKRLETVPNHIMDLVLARIATILEQTAFIRPLRCPCPWARVLKYGFRTLRPPAFQTIRSSAT